MFMLENRITIEERPILEEYLRGFEYGTSGFPLHPFTCGGIINEFCWQIIGDYLCIAGGQLSGRG